MAFNGAGVYNPISSPDFPAVAGTTVRASQYNNQILDIALALTNCVTRDGQSPALANISMGGFKLTGLTAGTGSGESLRYDQLFSQGVPIDIASAATVDIGAQNTTFLNVTGSTTISSLGTNYNGPRLLKFAASLTLTYNATTLITPSLANFLVSAGSYAIAVPKSTTSGIPDGWKIISYQQADGSTLPFVDTNPVVIGSVDSTKKARFEVDGLTTATTRVLTVQDKDITIAGLDDVNNAIALVKKTNLVHNSNFAINQRVVSGTVTLGAGQYGHDRWKAGTGGCTYTFSTTANITTISISAGTLQQVVEGIDLETATYVLSYSGTAQSRFNLGSYGASGQTLSVTGGASQTIEFFNGTVSKVKFEIGTVPTGYELINYQDDLYDCSFYCQSILFNSNGQGFVSQLTTTGGNNRHFAYLKTRMRSVPIFTFLGTWNLSTPSNIYTGQDYIDFFNAAAAFYATGPANTPAAILSADL